MAAGCRGDQLADDAGDGFAPSAEVVIQFGDGLVVRFGTGHAVVELEDGGAFLDVTKPILWNATSVGSLLAQGEAHVMRPD